MCRGACYVAAATVASQPSEARPGTEEAVPGFKRKVTPLELRDGCGGGDPQGARRVEGSGSGESIGAGCERG